MELHTRSDRSFYCWLLHACLKPFRGRLAAPSKVLPAGSNRISVNKKVRSQFRVNERQQDGIWIYEISLAAAKLTSLRLYYFAGGGWQMPPTAQHWKFCAELVRKVPGLVVTMVCSPHAPHSPAVHALPQLDGFVASIVEHGKAAGEKIILGGDSSGGNIALSLALRCLMKEAPGPSPDAVLAICPSVDLRPMECVDEIKILDKKDPVLKIRGHNDEADNWARDLDRSDPSISPVQGDMGLFAAADVKIIGVTGGYDILSHDALKMLHKCEAAGVKGSWLHWDKQMHCFPLTFMYRISEAVEAKDWIAEQLTKI